MLKILIWKMVMIYMFMKKWACKSVIPLLDRNPTKHVVFVC